MSRSAVVYNIQRYSLHDGPGIRTVVFFKGCPLRCRWCCNPESQNPQPEIACAASRCLGQSVCGLCAGACPRQALNFGADGRAEIDRALCVNCLKCAEVCPSAALRIEGRETLISEILDTVEEDAVFYRGGGGLTVSGGEPFFQGEALIELLREARLRKINTALETCGLADYHLVARAAALLDMVIYDLKSMDSLSHQRFTGQGNELILDNFRRLGADFPALPKLARTPVIPGFNDTAPALSAIAAFIAGQPGAAFEALPYHRFGAGKYALLGRDYPDFPPFDSAVMEKIVDIAARFG
ncbi:MAG: glycyl-radical enzyme activating protein [Candidatus Adiutrix sp.]|nr:glycyl-radical enzyme activating protein [Candidatus Adiutrix sp.]